MTDSGHIEIYRAEDGQARIEVRLEQDTLWLSQARMAVLFEKDSDTIGLHLKNVFEEGELDPAATAEESSVVRQEGKRQVRRTIRFYNLDAILSVGYRVRVPSADHQGGVDPVIGAKPWSSESVALPRSSSPAPLPVALTYCASISSALSKASKKGKAMEAMAEVSLQS